MPLGGHFYTAANIIEMFHHIRRQKTSIMPLFQ